MALTKARFVVFDLDGTLAPLGEGITNKDIALLKEIRNHGVRLGICSGKATFYLCGFIRQLGIPDMIMIGENGVTIQFGVELPPTTYCKLPYDKSVKEALHQIKRDVEEMIPDVWFQPNDVVVTPFLRTPEQFDMVQNYVDSHPELMAGVEVFRHVDCFDFVPKGLTKYDGLKKLTEMTGFQQDEMIAVGNGVNDIPMFNYAGLALGITLPDQPEVDINFDTITEALEYILTLV